MKNNLLKKILAPLGVLVFWLFVWQVFSLIVNDGYLLPSPIEVLTALIGLFGKASFYRVVLFSLLRVLLGLVIGILGGLILAFGCHHSSILRRLLTPIISIIKAMPVATFILILWITLRGSALTVFIGFIMVMPIIFQNTLEGLDSLSTELDELTRVFEFGFIKRLRVFVFPSLLPYLSAAIITSVGLAFKSQIAAEIIAYTKNSIGQYIYDANFGLQTDLVFAWAAVIVSFSIGLESLCRGLLRRVKNYA